MKRIDATHHADGRFVDPNAQIGRPGTRVDAGWLNGVQEEIVAPILAAGMSLDGDDHSQLLRAVRKLAVGFMTLPEALADLQSARPSVNVGDFVSILGRSAPGDGGMFLGIVKPLNNPGYPGGGPIMPVGAVDPKMWSGSPLVSDFQAAINFAQTHQVELRIASAMPFAGTAQITAPLRMIGSAGGIITQLTARAPILRVIASNVKIEGLSIFGEGTHANDGFGVEAVSKTLGDAIVIGDGSTTLNDVTIRDINHAGAGDFAVAVIGAQTEAIIGADDDDDTTGAGNDAEKIPNLVSDILIERVTAVGSPNANSRDAAAIRLLGGTDIEIKSCNLSSFGQGVLASGSPKRVNIHHNAIHDMRAQHGVYIAGAEPEYIDITDNEIWGVQTGVKSVASHSKIERNRIVKPEVWGVELKSKASYVSVRGNDIIEPGNNGLQIRGNVANAVLEHITIEGNLIVDAVKNGVFVDWDLPGIIIRHLNIDRNTITGAGERGVLISSDQSGHRSDNITVDANEIRSCAKQAIQLKGTGNISAYPEYMSNVSVQQNRCFGNYATGNDEKHAQISLEQCENAQIGGNMLTSGGSGAPAHCGIYAKNIRSLNYAQNSISADHAIIEHLVGIEDGYRVEADNVSTYELTQNNAYVRSYTDAGPQVILMSQKLPIGFEVVISKRHAANVTSIVADTGVILRGGDFDLTTTDETTTLRVVEAGIIERIN